jgi:ATP-dependent exoDNAse (exonuclease V) beta subunit
MLQQIKASAGSGKTYTLTRQFLTLLKDAVEDARPACAIRHAEEETESGHSWPEILAVTFTNKAATEMRERIVRSLKERALDIEPRTGTHPRHPAGWIFCCAVIPR